MGTIPVESQAPKMFCGECGGAYPAEDLARFGNNVVCVNCKPGYVQRLREGAQPVGGALSGVKYGGFWIRALAMFIDGLIVSIVTIPIFLVAGFGSGSFRTFDPQNPPVAAFASFGLAYLVILALVFAYHVWFVSKKGGTPGKLILGLRVVTVAGNNLSVAHAIARYFGVMLSAFTLYIGYIIAAFDSEKRALHDHICSTRVIRRS